LTQIILQGEGNYIRSRKAEGGRISETPLKRIAYRGNDNDSIAINMIDDTMRRTRASNIKTMVDALTLTNGIKDIIIAG
jgi:hypothetical protein